MQGRLCDEHLKAARACAGKWECAWPGCQQLSATGKGLCGYHAKIAAGQMESFRR